MSRHPEKTRLTSREEKIAEEYVNYVTNESVPKAMTLTEMKKATENDATLQAVIRAVQSGNWSQAVDQSVDEHSYNAYRRVKDELAVNHSEGIVLRQRRIVMPHSLQSRAVRLAHEGHQGVTKTKSLIREKIWFPGIDKMVEGQVDSCLPCQVATPKTQREPLQMSVLPKAAWTEISIDFATLDSEYLLVVTDDYSRFPVVEVISSVSANVVIPTLDKILAEHGIPNIIRSDNGSPFNSQSFKLFSEELGFHHRKITPLWPMANSEVERFMRTIKKLIKTAAVAQLNWKQDMYKFLRNYRATPHCTTGVAPATLLYNRSMGYEASTSYPSG